MTAKTKTAKKTAQKTAKPAPAKKQVKATKASAKPAPAAKAKTKREITKQAEIIAESFAAQGIRGPTIQEISDSLEAGQPVATPTPVEQPTKAKRDNSKFKKTLHGKSTYTCGCCGKLTRDTGLGEDSCDLCAFCYEEAGLENSLSDGNITQAQFDEEHTALVARHKRGAKGEPKAAKTKEPKQPRVTVASRARALVLEGLSNEEIFTKLQAEFGLGDDKKHYPGWYRGQLKRKGLLAE